MIYIGGSFTEWHKVALAQIEHVPTDERGTLFTAKLRGRMNSWWGFDLRSI